MSVSLTYTHTSWAKEKQLFTYSFIIQCTSARSWLHTIAESMLSLRTVIADMLYACSSKIIFVCKQPPHVPIAFCKLHSLLCRYQSHLWRWQTICWYVWEESILSFGWCRVTRISAVCIHSVSLVIQTRTVVVGCWWTLACHTKCHGVSLWTNMS